MEDRDGDWQDNDKRKRDDERHRLARRRRDTGRTCGEKTVHGLYSCRSCRLRNARRGSRCLKAAADEAGTALARLARHGGSAHPRSGRPRLMPSTIIRSIEYRSDARELEVAFTTGRRYVYNDVPPEAAEAFRSARIKGRHFNSRIRGRYPFTERTSSAEPS